MKSLADLLLFHKVPGIREAQARETIAEVITLMLQVPVTSRQITYTKGEASVAVPPVMKSALRLKEQEIRNLLQERGVKVSIMK